MHTISIQTNIENAIRERYARLIRAEHDLAYRNVVLEVCRRDPVRWINDWVWTSDPRNSSRGLPITIPFLLWDKQEQYILWRRSCVANKKFGIVAKSRDSGMSWLNCADQLHRWLFEEDYKGAFGSRKEGLIDKLGDPDTLFQKMRFILKTLPSWMRPKDYFDGYMRLINRDRNNVISAEAGDNLGRGGRNSVYDVDEFGFLERQEIVLAALSQNTDTVILTSTPNGADNAFARIYQASDEGFSRFRFHWKEDPRKNVWIVPGTDQRGIGQDAPSGAIYPWYEDQKTKLTPLIIAQELDIDFSSSVEGIVIRPEWVRAAVNYRLVMSNDRRTAGLDIATEGKDRSVFVIVDAGNNVIFIDSWQGQNTTETAHRAIALCHQHRVDTLNFDVVGVGAGVSGVLQTTPNLQFKYNPINGGSAPSDIYWPAEQRSSKEKFYNRRAELYYLAAERFKKTWENVTGIAKHPTDECISIPDNPTLIHQLSITTAKYTENGKILLIPKKDLKVSPDFADSLVYALANDTSTEFRTTRATW